MDRYYSLTYPEEYDYGIGYAPDGVEFDLLPEEGDVVSWSPITFMLKDGGFADLQANDLGWLMCSRKLMSICDGHGSAEDQLQWLPVVVAAESGEQRGYFVLHFIRRPDVVDMERSLLAPGRFVVKPVLSRRAIGPHQLFSFPGGESIVYVSAKLKGEIEETSCTGVDFCAALLSGG